MSFDRSNYFLIGESANSAQTFKKCCDQPAIMEPLPSENSGGKDPEIKSQIDFPNFIRHQFFIHQLSVQSL